MSAATQILNAAASGVAIRVREGKLLCVAASDRPSEEVLEPLRRHRQEITAHLDEYTRRFQSLGERVESVLPLAPLKVGILYQQYLHPESAAYNMGFLLSVSGRLDVEAWVCAWRSVLARHCDLRSLHLEDDGQFWQIILSNPKLPLRIIHQRDATTNAVADEVLTRPFSLENELPLRLAVIESAETKHLLVVCLHHIASDADSLVILLEEVRECYSRAAAGAVPEIAPANLDDAIHSIRHEAWTRSKEYALQLETWCAHVAGAPILFDTTPGDAAGDFERFPVSIDTALERQLLQLPRTERLTPFHAILGAMARALCRVTGHKELLIGVPARALPDAHAERAIGCFVNLLPVRLQPFSQESPLQILDAVRDAMEQCLSRRAVPLAHIWQHLASQRHHGPTEVQAVLTFVSQQLTLGDWPGLSFDTPRARFVQGKFAINAQLHWSEGHLRGHLELGPAALRRTSGAEMHALLAEELAWLLQGVPALC